MRILVAEDNIINQKVALRLLERLGYQADVAATGHQVLDRLEGGSYDVILMDVQMPEMDGLEATREICRRWPAALRPRIIAMTAEAMGGDRERGLAAGMDDYVVKPISLHELRRALGRCRAVGAPPPAEPDRTDESGGAGSRDVLDRGVLDQLREDLGGAAALQPIVSTFLNRTPVVLAELKTASARGDAPAVLAAAHALKGTSATLGALALSEQCAELERLARAERIADIAGRLSLVERLCGAADRALRAELGGGE